VTFVVAAPDPSAERLYVVGPGNVLPMVANGQKWRAVALSDKEIGYVAVSTGFLVEVALGEINHPLGFARTTPDLIIGIHSKRDELEVRVPQPDGEQVVIYNLKPEDRLPIAAESSDGFLVQLPSGMRGWIGKKSIVRTLTADSLPKEESTSVLGTLLGAALLIGLSASYESYQRNRISDAVADGIRRA
jgi:hypothetical protein